MSRPIVVTACIFGSSESGHPIGDPGTYVPVKEPSTASKADIALSCFLRQRPCDFAGSVDEKPRNGAERAILQSSDSVGEAGHRQSIGRTLSSERRVGICEAVTR